MAVNATAVWRARPSGVNTNGGGYDPGIAGAGTDYSRQNAAQATGTNGAGSATTTFTDTTANAFTSAMVGNAINIAGQGFYFVTAFLTAGTVTVDRALGTFSGATWRLGGGWADFWTNTQSSGPLVPGNIVYVLGSGIPNPSSYTYDYNYVGGGTAVTPVNGNTTAGFVQFLNDPSTPSYRAPPDTTGGMPVIGIDGPFMNSASYNAWAGLWFGARGSNSGFVLSSGQLRVFGCVFDHEGLGISGWVTTPSGCFVIGNELWSSVSSAAIFLPLNVGGTAEVIGNNLHDMLGSGSAPVMFSGNPNGIVANNIIAKCTGTFDGIYVSTSYVHIFNNTIDGNAGHGIEIGSQATLASCSIFNNIISNHTSGNGISVDAGTAAQNALVALFADYNTFYNNTANYNAISAGPHDTALGVSPYVNSVTQNYTLA